MSWTFKQSTGGMTNHLGEVVEIGYAGGDCGAWPAGRNNPAMQDIHNVGPLPQGTYTIDAPADSLKLGPFAIPLTPAPANQMFGRSGFFIHGDRIGEPGHASDGCIIMSRDTREAIWHSNDHTLEVVA